jgi:S1-C subfamily serine protease
VTRIDWFALGFVAFAAFIGFRKGLIGTFLALAGIVLGAVIGARLAPHLLSEGSRSPYTPLAGLAGAALGAIVLESLGTIAGSALRRSLRIQALRTVDTAGGVVLGALAGFAVVWVVGAVALHLPGQTELRQGAQRSLVLQRLNELLPPTRMLRALARVDPLPAFAGPSAPVAPPDPRVLHRPRIRSAAPSVMRVLGTACGLGVSGSGWVGARGVVVTAAHVVAGEGDTTVQPAGGVPRLRARVVLFDSRNDIAVLRVPGLGAPALRLAETTPGEPVAILGFPGNDGLVSTPGRIGLTSAVLARDAYGNGPVVRTITTLRGAVRHGDSGAPAVDRRGAVQATVFASRPDGRTGYGVPSDVIRKALANAGTKPVSTGDCSA